MKYLIHTCKTRLWYVEKHLIKSMLQQDIKFGDIDVYVDENNDGNLRSTLRSFSQLPEYGITCHLQDDIILASYFHERIQDYDLPFPLYNVVCGFASVYDKGLDGEVHPEDMWYSFPCIMIHNKYAHEFVDYVENCNDDNETVRIANNMFDDWLFKKFMIHNHPEEVVMNEAPNLVNNIDYLIGGSILSARKEKIVSMYWNEPELIEELKKKL